MLFTRKEFLIHVNYVLTFLLLNILTDIDECENDPCVNNGVCSNTIGSYECNCDGTGYEGKDCDIGTLLFFYISLTSPNLVTPFSFVKCMIWVLLKFFQMWMNVTTYPVITMGSAVTQMAALPVTVMELDTVGTFVKLVIIWTILSCNTLLKTNMCIC